MIAVLNSATQVACTLISIWLLGRTLWVVASENERKLFPCDVDKLGVSCDRSTCICMYMRITLEWFYITAFQSKAFIFYSEVNGYKNTCVCMRACVCLCVGVGTSIKLGRIPLIPHIRMYVQMYSCREVLPA